MFLGTIVKRMPTSIAPKGLYTRWLFFSVLAAVVIWSVLGRGLPALRHDWRFPAEPGPLEQVIVNYTAGWLPTGLGEPQPYPTFYLLAGILWPIEVVVRSPVAFVAIIIAASVGLISSAAWRVSTALKAPPVAAAAIAAFAVLNPWVFAKYVAGHVYMVATYGIALAIVGELLSGRRSRARLILFCGLLISQLQFYLLLAPVLMVWSIKNREWKVAAALVAAAVPIVVGIAGNWSDLHRTLFFLPWQEGQSVPIAQGLQLRGYSFGYAGAFSVVSAASVMLLCICGLGLRRAVQNRVALAVVILGGASLILASGTRGPIGPIYKFAVTHIVAIGVFRELYDIIAFVAIGCVVLLAIGLRRRGWLSYAALASALALGVPWVMHPAFSFFVPATSVPNIDFPTGASTRIALLPAFQPLTLSGRGSGYDPNSYVVPGRAVPVNQFYPEYPVNFALSRAEQGNYAALAALSVSRVYFRDYLQSDTRALKYQLSGTPPPIAFEASTSRSINPYPLAAIVKEPPPLTLLGLRPGDYDRFFGDALPGDAASIKKAAASIAIPQADMTTTDARHGWIDVRLVALSKPFLQNPYGGVYTESPAVLSVPRRTSLLAWTSRRIIDRYGHTVAKVSNTLHWVSAEAAASPLKCEGQCAVVMSADVPASLPLVHRSRNARALKIREITPWLYTVKLPPGAFGTLRFSERFDRSWTAGFPWGLQHLRISGIFNGWVLPAQRNGGVLYLYERVAALQCALELTVAVLIVSMLIGEMFCGREDVQR